MGRLTGLSTRNKKNSDAGSGANRRRSRLEVNPRSPESARSSRVVSRNRSEFFAYHNQADNQNASPQKQNSSSNSRRRSGVDPSNSRQRIGAGSVGDESVLSRFIRSPKGGLPVIVAIVLMAGCLLYSTVLTSDVRVSVDGEAGFRVQRPIQDYSDSARQIFNKSILSRNKLTINRPQLERDLLSQFPEIDSVAISIPLLGHRPVVSATASSPVLVLSSPRGSFVVSSKGRVLADAAEAINLADDILRIQDDMDFDIKPGDSILSEQDVTFITTLAHQFKAKNMKISSLILPPLASELHLRLEGKPYYIKFNLLTDARVTAGQYIALDKKLSSDGVVPAEYVDSRIEERIYYK